LCNALKGIKPFCDSDLDPHASARSYRQNMEERKKRVEKHIKVIRSDPRWGGSDEDDSVFSCPEAKAYFLKVHAPRFKDVPKKKRKKWVGLMAHRSGESVPALWNALVEEGLYERYPHRTKVDEEGSEEGVDCGRQNLG